MTKRAKARTKAKTSPTRAVKTARAEGKRSKANRATKQAARRPAVGDALGDFVDAAARALDLPIDPAWKGAVKANLAVTFALAASFADFPLPEDAEPAPVFEA